MCGIIGIFNDRNAKKQLLKGLKTIGGRGKDGFGMAGKGWTEFTKEIQQLHKSKKGSEDENLIGHCLHSVVSFVPQPIME